ncbi:dephospho-CoA kinase [Conexibacter sp. DBS9H8]|uniref:dephospho-CoA kinase n=1 Tax=Conexibacter sp. DBS9H8 TaxID=2937801 RepID=UPI00200BA7E2|nr:dephospho-CoA kinase [Conexibacter sp. DBS9H8]
MIPFVGLTGGIGSGKSAALAAFERLGAATLSTDAVVHDLYRSAAVRAAVVGRLGTDVAPDGRVDRDRLAAAVFADDDLRRWLESLLWPLVAERIAGWRAGLAARVPLPRAAVVEVPLLFEAGMESTFDVTLTVVANEGVRAARAAARGHASVAERTARQLSQQEKAARSTYVVENDGSESELEATLSDVLDILHT